MTPETHVSRAGGLNESLSISEKSGAPRHDNNGATACEKPMSAPWHRGRAHRSAS